MAESSKNAFVPQEITEQVNYLYSEIPEGQAAEQGTGKIKGPYASIIANIRNFGSGWALKEETSHALSKVTLFIAEARAYQQNTGATPVFTNDYYLLNDLPEMFDYFDSLESFKKAL